MPTVVGLYAALAAMLLYWLWGSSRELNVGPESTVAIMVATVLTPMAATGTGEYASLAAMLAILVGARPADRWRRSTFRAAQPGTAAG